MVEARGFIEALKWEGLGPCTGMPCSMLRGAMACAASDPQMRYYTATNEAEAMGIAAGLALTGCVPVIFMPNSGLGNALDPLASLSTIYGLPALLVVSLRGEPGQGDEPQHLIMGKITADLLQAIGIPFDYAAGDTQALQAQVHRLAMLARARRAPVALVIKKGVLAEENGHPWVAEKPAGPLLSRARAIETVVDCQEDRDAVIASNGKIARELYALSDRAGNFYMMGSSGCASAIALGVALSHKQARVVVLDGDGALLMHLGNMVSIGAHCPSNLIHVVLDNGCYESSGGLPTLSRGVRLELFALAAGYSTVSTATTEEKIRLFFQRMAKHGPHFLRVVVAPGSDPALGQARISPMEIASRFANFLKKRQARPEVRVTDTECLAVN